MQYIREYSTLSLDDVVIVGGKNASLGEMTRNLTALGIRVPEGCALTVDAYWDYLKANKLIEPITREIKALESEAYTSLSVRAARIRELIKNGIMPDVLRQEVAAWYKKLSDVTGGPVFVAVRSSATAEDLPGASFAGQQETFLYVVGVDELCKAIIACMASLFTDRAVMYRYEKKFDHMKVGLSVGIQRMIAADVGNGCSGVAFSLDTETGHPGFVLINGTWGLGELIVQGVIVPDEYLVHKDRLQAGFPAIVKKVCGTKQKKLVYNQSRKVLERQNVAAQDQQKTVLSDTQIVDLAHAVLRIEEHYTEHAQHWTPVDIEWAIDGKDGQLYILQARPETVHASRGATPTLITYTRKDTAPVKRVVEGTSVGTGVVTGVVRVLNSVADAHLVKQGDIIVTRMTDPDWMPVLKKVAGVITQEGGRTCHAAIVSRELGITALVGAADCMTLLKNDQIITIDCSQGARGYVYEGEVLFERSELVVADLPKPSVPLMVIIADPERALHISRLPVSGVGLARLEFIIAHTIGIHPMALVHPEKVTDQRVSVAIAERIKEYDSGAHFFVEVLARNISQIAAAFYPNPILVRMSDFKTNEYRALLGGIFFEQKEENPMLGFRGASRYVDVRYADAFALECKVILHAREVLGFDNIRVMVPFVRTATEAELVVKALADHGLVRGKNGLELYMMCEIPSNVLLIEQFAKYFDGFSIGSNDLTQLTLGVDRDAGVLAAQFTEQDSAVLMMMQMAVTGAHKAGKPIGICGQAPSDYPDIAQFLIKSGIDTISLNADSVIPYLMRCNK